MKKIFVFFILFFSILALGQDAIETPPEWLVQVLSVIGSAPVIGPALVKIVQWLGVIGTVLTILAGSALGILKSLEIVLNAAKTQELALKVASLKESKILYYLKYFSFMNAQKK